MFQKINRRKKIQQKRGEGKEMSYKQYTGFYFILNFPFSFFIYLKKSALVWEMKNVLQILFTVEWIDSLD